MANSAPNRLRAVARRVPESGDFMPDQHREFFALLPAIFVSVPDEDGWPLAAILTGAPGFVSSPDPGALHIAATVTTGSTAGLLLTGRSVGVLGLDFATRRRNRANGVIAHADATGFTVAVAESFGNCAKYIQTRQVRTAGAEPGPFEEPSGLDADAVSLIRLSDTFFLASGFVASGAAETTGGMDISHRGGRPGFVQISGNELIIPDFSGNRYFNTFGNLADRAESQPAVHRLQHGRRAAPQRDRIDRLEPTGYISSWNRAGLALPNQHDSRQRSAASALGLRGVLPGFSATGVW